MRLACDKENTMRTLTHIPSTEHRPLLSGYALEILRGFVSVLAPYAIAALALFIYHEQFPL